MHITLHDAAIGSGLAAAVPALSLDLWPGAPSVVRVETAERPMLVSLLIAGRLRAESGAVLVDGENNPDRLRRSTALVDTPVAAEPSPGVPLRSVIAEDFSFAGRRASAREINGFLLEHGLLSYADLAVRSLPPAHRVRLFAELAVLRPGVRAVVVTSPERHGGEPTDWYAALDEIAQRGLTVVIVTDAATADRLIELGARPAAAPAEPTMIEDAA